MKIEGDEHGQFFHFLPDIGLRMENVIYDDDFAGGQYEEDCSENYIFIRDKIPEILPLAVFIDKKEEERPHKHNI